MWTWVNRDAVRQSLERLAGLPPQVALREAYPDRPGGPEFDHAEFDRLLQAHVDAEGWVDHRGLNRDAGRLDRYIAALGRAPFDEMGRDEKLALLINAYNAFTLRLILDHFPLDSIKDIPEPKRWDDRRWKVGRSTWSLNQIEHEEIRPKFAEPRIHFALVCAAVGCPPLRTEAYTGERLEQQLEQQAERVHADSRWFRFDARTNTVSLTELYQWYRGDFESVADSVLDYAAQYSPELRSRRPRSTTALTD